MRISAPMAMPRSLKPAATRTNTVTTRFSSAPAKAFEIHDSAVMLKSLKAHIRGEMEISNIKDDEFKGLEATLERFDGIGALALGEVDIIHWGRLIHQNQDAKQVQTGEFLFRDPGNPQKINWPALESLASQHRTLDLPKLKAAFGTNIQIPPVLSF